MSNWCGTTNLYVKKGKKNKLVWKFYELINSKIHGLILTEDVWEKWKIPFSLLLLFYFKIGFGGEKRRNHWWSTSCITVILNHPVYRERKSKQILKKYIKNNEISLLGTKRNRGGTKLNRGGTKIKRYGTKRNRRGTKEVKVVQNEIEVVKDHIDMVQKEIEVVQHKMEVVQKEIEVVQEE